MRANNICQYCPTKENLFGEYYFGPWGSNVISTFNFTVQQRLEPAGMSQSVWAGQRKNLFRFPAGPNIFPLLQRPDPALGPTQLPISTGMSDVFPGDKSGRCLKLTTHIYIYIYNRYAFKESAGTALLSRFSSK
jgi:hypothetical protein